MEESDDHKAEETGPIADGAGAGACEAAEEEMAPGADADEGTEAPAAAPAAAAADAAADAAAEEMAPADVMEGIDRLFGGTGGRITLTRGGSGEEEGGEAQEDGGPPPGIRVVFGGLNGLNGM